MENNEVLESFISTLRVKLGDASFRVAELETLLILEQKKNSELEKELEQLKQTAQAETDAPKGTTKG